MILKGHNNMLPVLLLEQTLHKISIQGDYVP